MKKMIKTYVNDVVRHLPFYERRKARRIITATIYEQLNEYTDGLRPLRKDVKEVLKEMGRPSKLAKAYYRDFHKPMFRSMNVKGCSQFMVQLGTIFAFVLVGIGLMQLLVGSQNVVSLVLGAFLGIVTQLYQVVGNVKESYEPVR